LSFECDHVDRIVEVLEELGFEGDILTDWSDAETSPAGVVTRRLYLWMASERFVLKRQDYSGWDSPQFSIDMTEPVDRSAKESIIETIRDGFEGSPVDFTLVDYGILPSNSGDNEKG